MYPFYLQVLYFTKSFFLVIVSNWIYFFNIAGSNSKFSHKSFLSST